MISVGIIGASGYTGEELVKILQNHPNVNIKCLASRKHAGKKVDEIFSLDKPIGGEFVSIDIANFKGCDVVFFATPNGVAMDMARELLSHDIRLIDISADFRLSNVEEWEKWYGVKHTSSDLLKNSIYGLPEIQGQKEKIRNASIVANPGCYPTSVLLALLPIYESLNSQQILVDSKSGISGAGRNLNTEKLFSPGSDNFQAYAVGTHRHYPEMLQILQSSKTKLDVLFVPHLSSMERGIFSTIYLNCNTDITDLQKNFKSFYKDSPFVEVLECNSFPKVSEVAMTNNCKISLQSTPNSDNGVNLVIFSVIDNLVKGASGQAVQNMNIMFGFDEKASLN
tara:strand:- start:7 stop:1023 length:1017 start_codon:yes stop_codon:yes gene_type:complete